MRHREIQKRTFERIGYILRNTTYAQLTRLGLPKHLFHESTEVIWNYIQTSTDEELKSIEWEYTEDLQEIERRLLEWNIHHFNQAHTSPLATKYWQDKLDPIHKSEDELEDILHHTLLDGEELSAETICLLEQISNNLQPMMDEKRTKITEEHFRSFYKCTPEDKSASPSGLHLGHYKSAASNETFSFVLWSIICMAYQNSFCLDRWKLSATTLLEKIPGFPKIHKFRTIHIIESDLNFVMRFIWGREFMAHNETNDGFHDNQYGGRKGRQPQSAILNKVLTLDIVRYQAEEAGLLDNDAKACYDRVLPYLTAYMLRRLGMPYFLSRFMCVVLKEMEYKIKLSNGMTASYSNKNKTVFGTGQGAGWSPTCWAANSDVISHSMEKYTPGMALRHPDGKVYSNITLVAFVDDTSMGVTQEGINTFNPKPYWPVQPQQTMYKQLEANIGFYGRTLESTGGALAWEKCKAYLIMFLWLNGVKIMINNKNDFPALRVFSLLTGMYHFIKLANPDEAFRMLGAFVAPNGSMSTQIKILKELALKWARKITKSYLTPHECLIAYKQVLFPALVYPLAVMPVSEKDCDDIIRPALNALLTKLNINKTTCRKLLYGPARYGGMELPNIYVYGNILKVMMLIGHMQKEDATMPILTTSLATV